MTLADCKLFHGDVSGSKVSYKHTNTVRTMPVSWHHALLAVTTNYHTHTHTHLMAICPGLPRWAGNRKVKQIWILLQQETVSGTGISWAICKSASRSRQTTMPAPNHSVFYRPDALPATQPTASKHWRQFTTNYHIVWNNNALPSVLWHRWFRIRKSIWPVKIEWWGVVICLEWDADCLHMVQLMPLLSPNPIVSCLI